MCLIGKKCDKMFTEAVRRRKVKKDTAMTKGIHMNFYKNLYIGDTVKKPQKAIKKLKRYKKQPRLYVIVYDGETDRLAVYHSLMLLQWYYRENPPGCIVGLANGREEAFDVIEQIAKESLAATGQAQLVAYLSGVDPESFKNVHASGA